MRHETWDQWLDEKRDITYVLKNLGIANFDPEFFAKHELEIINAYNENYPEKTIIISTV
jgi:hypothetical protein